MSLEECMAEEAALLRLADAWVERTQGEVVPGVVWDASRYVRELKKVPLFENVKGKLEGCARSVRRNNEWEKDDAFLVYFPSVRYVIERFLREPDYCCGGGNKLGSPKKLEAVLMSYISEMNGGEGWFETHKGDARRVGAALSLKRFTESELLDAIGLREKWEAYQKTKMIPKDYKRETKRVIEHFLRDPDYCCGRSGFGSPKKLKRVLTDYVSNMSNGDGGFELGKGDARRVGNALYRKKLTEEELLGAIGLREKWEAYLKTRGIPKSHRKEAKKILEHFLRYPDYCGGGGGKKFGTPKKLKTVLMSYVSQMNDGRGGFEKDKGDAHRVGEALYRKFTESELLDVIGLKEVWQDYQNTTADNPFVYDPKKYEKKPECAPRYVLKIL